MLTESIRSRGVDPEGPALEAYIDSMRCLPPHLAACSVQRTTRDSYL